MFFTFKHRKGVGIALAPGGTRLVGKVTRETVDPCRHGDGGGAAGQGIIKCLSQAKGRGMATCENSTLLLISDKFMLDLVMIQYDFVYTNCDISMHRVVLSRWLLLFLPLMMG